VTDRLAISEFRAEDIRNHLDDKCDVPDEWFVPSDRYGLIILFRILAPFLLILVSGPWIWANVSPWACLTLVLPTGVYAYKISFIIHDCCHFSLFTNRKVNDWVGRLSWSRFVGQLGSQVKVYSAH